MKRTAVVVIALAAAVAGSASAQRSPQSMGAPGIENLMSAKEFEAAGLRKLSEAELGILNEWLKKYTVSVA